MDDDRAAAASPPVAGFSANARRVLVHLCARLVASDSDAAMLARAVEARLAPEHDVRERVEHVLLGLDRPVASRIFGGRGRRFTALPPEDQDAWLRALSTSASPLRHAALEGLRRIVLSTYYAMPAVARSVGYAGPLHTREPVFSWEGPLTRDFTGDEPTARAARTPPPRPSIASGIIQGHELPPRTELRADVCVIGSGAGGAVVAALLAEAGHDVVVLEEGGYWSSADFTENEDVMVPRLYADGGMRATTDVGLSLLQGRCVGGGTTVNWLLMLRPPRWIMEEWEQHGAELLAPALLEPALARIEADVHASPVPGEAHSPSNRMLLDAAAQLGWRAFPARINARDCVRAGSCGLGCRYRAKQGALETWIPRALASAAVLFSDVQAVRLQRARSGPAPTTRVEAVVLDRATRRPRGSLAVEAPIVVLAAGAVGTPILLRQSGLGGGAVGRFLRLHPTTAVLGLYERPMYAAAGIPQSAVCDEFLDQCGGFGFWIECPPLYPGIGAAALPGFGATHRARLHDFPHFAPLIVLVRDGARPARSQGSVTATRTGAPRIRYRLGISERRTLAQGMHAAARMHRAAGAAAVITLHDRAPRFFPGDDVDWILHASTARTHVGLYSAHVNGTCRMGPDPRTSGCSPDAERHGAPGIFIADGSLLPSAPGANPQAVIMAAASLVAQRILSRQ